MNISSTLEINLRKKGKIAEDSINCRDFGIPISEMFLANGCDVFFSKPTTQKESFIINIIIDVKIEIPLRVEFL